MKNLVSRLGRPAETSAMIPRFSRMHLTRTFVETGDERCPIAGIWSRLESETTADDGELTRPAMWRDLLWRAFSCWFRVPAF